MVREGGVGEGGDGSRERKIKEEKKRIPCTDLSHTNDYHTHIWYF